MLISVDGRLSTLSSRSRNGDSETGCRIKSWPLHVNQLGIGSLLTLAHPLRVAALGGGLLPCELPPLTLLVT
jgi:hypothetical protein